MSLQITETNFEELLKDNKNIVVDFYTEWCGACKALAPIIDEISEEMKDIIHVGKLNIDEAKEIAAKYEIRNIPTILFFKNGEVTDKQIGFANKDSLVDRIKMFVENEDSNN